MVNQRVNASEVVADNLEKFQQKLCSS